MVVAKIFERGFTRILQIRTDQDSLRMAQVDRQSMTVDCASGGQEP
jgi:hypothetical protein